MPTNERLARDAMKVSTEEPVMQATQAEMEAARIPLGWRDYCAHLLIPLNKCRTKELYLPWKCQHEKHVYELCQYEEFLRRYKRAMIARGEIPADSQAHQ
eukprot:c11366_g1_i1.p1 GENE.c11366_g1_i1~~c11366_g1_i1.p1  ORF type:complete len:112 (+),score=22.91 c11366_g1_i1:39-338(+)